MIISTIFIGLLVSWFFLTKNFTIMYNNEDYTLYSLVVISIVVLSLYVIQKNINKTYKINNINVITLIHGIYSILGLYVLINVIAIFRRANELTGKVYENGLFYIRKIATLPEKIQWVKEITLENINNQAINLNNILCKNDLIQAYKQQLTEYSKTLSMEIVKNEEILSSSDFGYYLYKSMTNNPKLWVAAVGALFLIFFTPKVVTFFENSDGFGDALQNSFTTISQGFKNILPSIGNIKDLYEIHINLSATTKEILNHVNNTSQISDQLILHVNQLHAQIMALEEKHVAVEHLRQAITKLSQYCMC